MAIQFDVEGARQEGYSSREIADHLGSQGDFDLVGARGEGYSDDEIILHLAGDESKQGFLPAFGAGIDVMQGAPYSAV